MRIAAFNVQNLGVTKIKDKTVLRNLIKIVSRYSVVVLLEVRDPDGNVMKRFHTQLNLLRGNRTRPYMMELSPRVGRNNHMERFAFFYRQDEMSVIHRYMYEEENGDVFAREPYIVQFERRTARVVKNLVLIPIHTKPQDAEHELRALHNVVQDARDKCRTDNIMILGDFNADGRYLNDETRKALSISSPPYYWLIDEDADTTTGANDHTYDRIVVYGETMMNAIVPNSAKPFNFQQEFKLTDEETLDISDHYPVEVELKTKDASGEGQSKKKGQQEQKRKQGQASNMPTKRGRRAV